MLCMLQSHWPSKIRSLSEQLARSILILITGYIILIQIIPSYNHTVQSNNRVALSSSEASSRQGVRSAVSVL